MAAGNFAALVAAGSFAVAAGNFELVAVVAVADTAGSAEIPDFAGSFGWVEIVD